MNEASFSMNFKAVTEGGLRAQLTVRGASIIEFESNFKEVLKFMRDNNVQTEVQASTKAVTGTQPDAEQPPAKDWCMVHDCKMDLQTNKDNTRSWYSHKTADPRYNNNSDYDSWFCNGKEPK